MNLLAGLGTIWEYFWSDPITGLAVAASLIALATTPVAFAVLGRRDWFKARRGRTLQRPSFVSIIVGMLLVMGIPAILLALLIKSRHFDENRYEFDPNQTLTIIDQGRGSSNRAEMEMAIRKEVLRLVGERKTLSDEVVRLDDAMTKLIAAACNSPQIAPAAPAVLAQMSNVRKYEKMRSDLDPDLLLARIVQGNGLGSREAINKAITDEMVRLTDERKNLAESLKKLDDAMLPLRAAAPLSQPALAALKDSFEPLSALHRSVGLDAPQQLIDLKANPVGVPATPAVVYATPTPVNVPAPGVAPTAAAPSSVAGLSSAEKDAEITGVPDPQRTLAGLLPLTDLPPGWVVGKSGNKHLETFNAENLFEKIDGRAESFIQYAVKGMAYAYYHPDGDELSEAQLYVFEMGDPLKAFGKYGSEKPDETKPASIGSEGYTSAGSTFFYSGKYYVQIVTTKDDAKLAEFSLDLAKRVAGAIKPANAPAAGGPAVVGPEEIFKLLPGEPAKSAPKFVTQDVFGYSFLTDVFLADYKDAKGTWQGWLRPFETAEAAKAAFEKYRDEAKKDGAEIQKVEGSDADEMVVANNAALQLIDVIFLKGNAVGGVNGATDAKAASAFAQGFAKSLPKPVPFIPADKKPAGEKSADGEGEGEPK